MFGAYFGLFALFAAVESEESTAPVRAEVVAIRSLDRPLVGVVPERIRRAWDYFTPFETGVSPTIQIESDDVKSGIEMANGRIADLRAFHDIAPRIITLLTRFNELRGDEKAEVSAFILAHKDAWTSVAFTAFMRSMNETVGTGSRYSRHGDSEEAIRTSVEAVSQMLSHLDRLASNAPEEAGTDSEDELGGLGTGRGAARNGSVGSALDSTRAEAELRSVLAELDDILAANAQRAFHRTVRSLLKDAIAPSLHEIKLELETLLRIAEYRAGNSFPAPDLMQATLATAIVEAGQLVGDSDDVMAFAQRLTEEFTRRDVVVSVLVSNDTTSDLALSPFGSLRIEGLAQQDGSVVSADLVSASVYEEGVTSGGLESERASKWRFLVSKRSVSVCSFESRGMTEDLLAAASKNDKSIMVGVEVYPIGCDRPLESRLIKCQLVVR